MAIDQRVAQREALRHTHHGVIDRLVTMWMQLTQYITHDGG